MTHRTKYMPLQRVMGDFILFTPLHEDDVAAELDEALAGLLVEIDKLKRMNREWDE